MTGDQARGRIISELAHIILENSGTDEEEAKRISSYFYDYEWSNLSDEDWYLLWHSICYSNDRDAFFRSLYKRATYN